MPAMPMRRRLVTVAAAAALITAGLTTGPAVARASVAPSHHHHACTRTSSGSCIRGGEFCRQADYGHKGYDAQGRKYICKGDRTHPHWELP